MGHKETIVDKPNVVILEITEKSTWVDSSIHLKKCCFLNYLLNLNRSFTRNQEKYSHTKVLAKIANTLQEIPSLFMFLWLKTEVLTQN